MRKWTLGLVALIAVAFCAQVAVLAKEGGKGKGKDNAARRAKKGEAKKGKGAEGKPRRALGGMMLLRVLDTDKDGELSADEITNATAALNKLDKDGDGRVSAKEMQPRRRKPGAGDAKPGGKGGKGGGKGGGKRGGKKGGKGAGNK